MELRVQYTRKLTLTATVPSLPCRAGCPKLCLVCLNAECDEESQSLYLSHRKTVRVPYPLRFLPACGGHAKGGLFRLPSRLIAHRHRPRAKLQTAHQPQVDTLR